jgi:hypothetical protein
MAFSDLTQFEIIQGFAGLISLSIMIFIGFIIVSKYFKYKKIEFMTVGLMMVFITSGWWGSTLNFLFYAFFNFEMGDQLYIFISYGIVSLASIFWIYSFSHIVYPDSKWKIFSIWLVISIVYSIFFIYYLFTDSSILAIRITRFDSETRYFVTVYILLSLLISLITQYIFLTKSIHSDDAIIRWKGKLIFSGYIIFLIGAVLDSTIALTPMILLLTRVLIVVCALISYIGWIMPKKVANLLVKK